MSNSLPRQHTRPAAALVAVTHGDGTTNETAGGRRCPTRPWRAGILAVAAALVLLTAAACGGSPSSSASSGASSAAVSGVLAYSHCMRAHGVPDFPDPGPNGQLPASTKNIANDPKFTAASDACRHLIHGSTSSQFAGDQRAYLQFAQCMRAHGEPSFPDPSTDPDGSPVFELQNAGINVQSPPVQRAALGCQSQLHLTKLPNYRV